jgi:amino acid transporter
MNRRRLFRRKSISELIATSEEGEVRLKRSLGVWDLTAFGIAAIIGAGIFGTIGEAASEGGPAVIFLFIFTAITCGFSALSYAEFASTIPISGSAYTYAYASFGELIAWIIGWDLLMEYAIGNIAVAISWSDYFTSFLHNVGIIFPDYLSMDFRTAWEGYRKVHHHLASGGLIDEVEPYLKEAYFAWQNAPSIGGIKLIMDLPALTIVILITYLIYIGITETKRANNAMVLFKILILLFVILLGSFYISVENWKPFAPHGFQGVMKGVAAVFFAYIGFDAISTTAEEARNPQKDLPHSMVYSLAITTLLYVLTALVLTGMVPYSELKVGDPLAYAFNRLHLPWISGLIAVGALVAMTTVLLVFQLGQPRIWMSMSRDGLLPPIFASIHPVYRTPSFSTILTGIVVAIPTLFMNLKEVTDLTSIGTLFAFVLVNGGVLIMHHQNNPDYNPRFRIPFLQAQWILTLLFIATIGLLIHFHSPKLYLSWENLPFHFFLTVFGLLVIASHLYRFSLIPALGLLSCLYLMSELHLSNWIRFGVWLLIGLVIYFTYGVKHSALNRKDG